jgi:hypothetical protein
MRRRRPIDEPTFHGRDRSKSTVPQPNVAHKRNGEHQSAFRVVGAEPAVNQFCYLAVMMSNQPSQQPALLL